MKVQMKMTWVGLFVIAAALLAACGAQQAPRAAEDTGVVNEQILDPVAEPATTEVEAEASSTTAVVGPTEAPPSATEPSTVDESGTDGYPALGYQFPTPDSDGAAEPYPSPEQVEPPPLKLELEATDPAVVNLAAGKPTLLEFFAFW